MLGSEALNGVVLLQAEQADSDLYRIHAKANLRHVGIGMIPDICSLQLMIQPSRTDRINSAKSSLTCRLLGSSSSSPPSTDVSAVPAASLLWV